MDSAQPMYSSLKVTLAKVHLKTDLVMQLMTHVMAWAIVLMYFNQLLLFVELQQTFAIFLNLAQENREAVLITNLPVPLPLVLQSVNPVVVCVMALTCVMEKVLVSTCFCHRQLYAEKQLLNAMKLNSALVQLVPAQLIYSNPQRLSALVYLMEEIAMAMIPATAMVTV